MHLLGDMLDVVPNAIRSSTQVRAITKKSWSKSSTCRKHPPTQSLLLASRPFHRFTQVVPKARCSPSFVNDDAGIPSATPKYLIKSFSSSELVLGVLAQRPLLKFWILQRAGLLQ